MRNVTADVDTILEFLVEEDSEYSSFCLRLYWVTWDTAIVIVRNLSDNSVNKIANITEKIVCLVSHNYNLSSNKIMLIEHYLADNSSNEDIYLHVLLTDNEAIKYEVEKSKLIELIGTKLNKL